MIKSNFLSPSERKELLSCAKSSLEDHGVARRANAILLLDEGESCTTIARFLYIDDDTVRNWYKIYIQAGWESLIIDNFKGKSSKLSSHQETELVDWLGSRFCRSTTEIITYIDQKFDIMYSKSGCIKLLHRLEFEYKKPRSIPQCVSEETQQQTIDRYEQKLNDLRPSEAIFFIDAVHPEHQSRPSSGWVKKGEKVAIKSNTKRQRLNIHGSINLETGDFHFVEEPIINAETTLKLLQKIENAHPELSKIYLICDNARYHHAKIVREWLSEENRRIELMFLPPYCPHLNAIEALWKQMHDATTRNIHYEKFQDFCDAILGFLTKKLPEEWPKLRDRITDNFRTISYENFRVL